MNSRMETLIANPGTQSHHFVLQDLQIVTAVGLLPQTDLLLDPAQRFAQHRDAVLMDEIHAKTGIQVKKNIIYCVIPLPWVTLAPPP